MTTPSSSTARPDVDGDVRRALSEDLGDGDRTASLIDAAARARATVVTREDAVLCGTDWFDATLRALDSEVTVHWQARDGDRIETGQVLCEIDGNARALLSTERTALNFLQTLSGTATVARRYLDRVAGLRVALLDTRKTLPGLRRAQKYAVRCGGCENHRLGLHDGILIKENHIAACGSIARAVEIARDRSPGLAIEVEVENLDQLAGALAAGTDIVLLDNFSLAALREAVALNRGSARLEASGGITLDNVRDIAETGVNRISIGALTKHLHAIDLSMRFAIDR